MPTQDEIQPKVIAAFAFKTHLSPEAITALVEAKTDDMFADLGMGGQAIDTMTGPLTEISTAYPGGLAVPISAVRKCDTVTDCIELTTKRAGGKK
jgi:hypothetical protein